MGAIQKVIFGLMGDFLLPTKMNSNLWFEVANGYVPGAVPYFGGGVAAVYWARAESEYYDDFLKTTDTSEDIAPYVRLLIEFRLGLEYRTEGAFALFVETGYLMFSPPLRGKDLKRSATGMDDFSWFWMYEVPIRVGVCFYFGGSSE